MFGGLFGAEFDKKQYNKYVDGEKGIEELKKVKLDEIHLLPFLCGCLKGQGYKTVGDVMDMLDAYIEKKIEGHKNKKE